MEKDPIELMVDAIDADIESKRNHDHGNNDCTRCAKRCYGNYCKKCLLEMGIDPDFKSRHTASSSKREGRQPYVVRESNNDDTWN